MLEEITGVQQFLKKEKDSLKQLQDIQRESVSIKENLDEITKKLGDLSLQKEMYEEYHTKEVEYNW